MRSPQWFYPLMAGVAAIVVFIGFSRSYYLKGVFGRPPLPLLAHVHGLLFTSWIVLLLVQTFLVSRGQVGFHRRLGAVGGVLAAFMVVAGTAMGIMAARRDALGSPAFVRPALGALTVPFFDMVVFAILITAALLYRRRPHIHKRLILVATVTLLPAAVARFPSTFIHEHGELAFFGLTDLLLVACILFDTIRHRRLHPAFLWGGLLLIASHPLRNYIGETNAWIAFAHWLTRL